MQVKYLKAAVREPYPENPTFTYNKNKQVHHEEEVEIEASN